jgi:hypothetical protein
VTTVLPPEWHGPSLSFQIRTAGSIEGDLAEAFRQALVASGGSYERVGERMPVAPKSSSRSYERWRVRDLDPLGLSISTWNTDGDAVLVVNLALRPLKKYGSVLPDEFISLLVDAARSIHQRYPLRVGIIGEEALVAAGLLDLWDSGRRPTEDTPGTLWPTPQGSLSWNPRPPIDLQDV